MSHPDVLENAEGPVRAAQQLPWPKQTEAACVAGSRLALREAPRPPHQDTHQLIPGDLAFLLLGYPAKEKQKHKE